MNAHLSISLRTLVIVLAAVGSTHAAGYANPAQPQSRDRLAWLGPLPPNLTQQVADDAFEQAINKTIDSIAADITAADAGAFVCHSPTAAGPVPDLDAVDRYIEGFPASANGGKLQDDLFKAAAKGNWLARSWVFTSLTEERPLTDEAAYRSAQLLDLMRVHRTGQIYVFVGRYYNDHLAFSRMVPADGPGQFEIAAASHSSYPAQFRVGQHLVRDPDPKLKRIGKAMLDCARTALPAYARFFNVTNIEETADD